MDSAPLTPDSDFLNQVSLNKLVDESRDERLIGNSLGRRHALDTDHVVLGESDIDPAIFPKSRLAGGTQLFEQRLARKAHLDGITLVEILNFFF